MSDLLSGTQMHKATFRRGGEPLICLLWKPQASDTAAFTLMSKAAQAVAALEWHRLRLHRARRSHSFQPGVTGTSWAITALLKTAGVTTTPPDFAPTSFPILTISPILDTPRVLRK